MRVYVLYFVHGDEDFGGGEQPSELRTGFGDIFGPGGWNWLKTRGILSRVGGMAMEGECRASLVKWFSHDVGQDGGSRGEKPIFG